MKIKSLGKALLVAKQIFKNREKIKSVYRDSRNKANENKDLMSEGLWDDVKTLGQMLKARINGSYTFSTRTVVYVIAGLLYFISPIDLIPDFIVGLGFLDDAAVLALVVKRIKKEIDKYRQEYSITEVEVIS